MPECQIGYCPVIGETPSEILQRSARQVEAQKLELILAENVVDLWQGELMFLNVEQRVAARAGAEKLRPVHDFRQRRTVANARELVAAAPNVFRGWAIAAS